MRFAFALLVLALVGCSQTPDLTVNTDGIPAADVPVVQQAFHALLGKCPALDDYRSDIVDVRAQTFSAAHSVSAADYGVARDHGWMKWIRFEIVISEHPRSIPSQWYAVGQHLFYDLGGKPNPGMDVAKAAAQRFCPGISADGFLSATEFAIVDNLP